jgi:Uma2 family endonuclease
LGYNITIIAAEKAPEPTTPILYTPQEYITAEKLAVHRSEYVEGRALPRANTSFVHNTTTSDILGAVGTILHANRSTCAVCTSQLRIKVSDAGPYFYPDISVVCGEALVDQHDSLQNPIAIFEVLSPSTSDFDHNEKFFHYRRIESLREYVLVHINRPFIKHYSLTKPKQWTLQEIEGIESELNLPALSISIPLKEIYRRLNFGA